MKEPVRVIGKRRDERTVQLSCSYRYDMTTQRCMQRTGYGSLEGAKSSGLLTAGRPLENDFHSFAGQLRVGKSPLA